MTKEKIQHYSHLVEDEKLSIELLILCLASLESRISKEAYLSAKFKNSWMGSNRSHDHEMKVYMGYRKQIKSILLEKYSENEIKMIVIQVNKDDMIKNKLFDSVVELIQSNDYCLTDS